MTMHDIIPTKSYMRIEMINDMMLVFGVGESNGNRRG